MSTKFLTETVILCCKLASRYMDATIEKATTLHRRKRSKSPDAMSVGIKIIPIINVDSNTCCVFTDTKPEIPNKYFLNNKYVNIIDII